MGVMPTAEEKKRSREGGGDVPPNQQFQSLSYLSLSQYVFNLVLQYVYFVKIFHVKVSVDNAK